MLKKIIAGLGILVIGLVVLVACQPATFRIERSILINADAATIFPCVNDLHRWDAWSPWARRDPAMKKTFDGPAAGVGAIYAWSGNNEVGEGRMTITTSEPDAKILLKLEFLKPFPATNTTEFTFAPGKGKGRTIVTWAMTGTNNFLGKFFSLIMNMDKMVGPDFEQGLQQLKQLAESTPAST